MKQLIINFRQAATMLLAAMLLLTCEKPILDETNGNEITNEVNVVLRFVQYEQFEQESFTRAATDMTELCSRLNIAIFDADGTKVKTVAQKEGDASYGTVALSLAAGTYKLVVVAHSCDGSTPPTPSSRSAPRPPTSASS